MICNRRSAMIATAIVGPFVSLNPVLADDIDTTPAWNGTSSIAPWGVPDTATYGQTITATANQTRLRSFTFFLSQRSGSAVNYRAHVYAWDPVNSRITGAPVFSSGVKLSPVTNNNFVPVTITTTSANLTPGRQYVLFLTTSGNTNPNGGSYGYGRVDGATYANGTFVFLNNGTDFSQLATSTWDAILKEPLSNPPTMAHWHH